ncbi:unnamed protein product [Urochloa humidicola]
MASSRRHPPAAMRLARAAAWPAGPRRWRGSASAGLDGGGARPARASTVAELGQRGPRRRRSSGRGRGGGGPASGARLGLSRTRAAEQRRGGGVAAAAPSSSLPKLVVLVGRILLVFLAGVRQQRRLTRSCCGGRSGGWRPQLPPRGWIERGHVRCSPSAASRATSRRARTPTIPSALQRTPLPPPPPRQSHPPTDEEVDADTAAC